VALRRFAWRAAIGGVFCGKRSCASHTVRKKKRKKGEE
jgi:hypothetical protein